MGLPVDDPARLVFNVPTGLLTAHFSWLRITDRLGDIDWSSLLGEGKFDDRVDGILLLMMFASANRKTVPDLVELLLEAKPQKPVITCFLAPPGIWDETISRMEKAGAAINLPAPERAAKVMTDNKVGGLPVIDDGVVVGIITETDLFQQFAAALGGGSDSLRLTVQVDDSPGQIKLPDKPV